MNCLDVMYDGELLCTICQNEDDFIVPKGFEYLYDIINCKFINNEWIIKIKEPYYNRFSFKSYYFSPTYSDSLSDTLVEL